MQVGISHPTVTGRVASARQSIAVSADRLAYPLQRVHALVYSKSLCNYGCMRRRRVADFLGIQRQIICREAVKEQGGSRRLISDTAELLLADRSALQTSNFFCWIKK